MNHFIIATPIGNLAVKCTNEQLARIEFLSSQQKPSPPSSLPSPIHHVAQEIKSYFEDPNHRFNLDLLLEGTAFQKNVWQALQAIPSGNTVNYQSLAQQLKTSPRAIGNACRANPLPIVVPCHRVVAKQHVGGYAGKTEGKMLDIKQWLLRHEKT